jgi:acetyl-CoA carboxylase biotin carboxylase subunit
MFRKILVANRGEIALRIIRACRELGIEVVAVHSEVDEDSLHVRLADEAVCIGPNAPGESYLNFNRIISAAEISDAEAIHPGYGFLAENAEFAEVCESCGIAWIGPSAATIAQMGNKSLAKQMMTGAGIPVIPGTSGAVADEKTALEGAETIGYPVIIKASAGGGGKGMRIARTPDQLANNLLIARAEAESAFGDATVYLEKFLPNPRHIEVQLLGDKLGNIVHLGERDCSVQRRHQKLIEESPCTSITPELRREILETAVAGARAMNYYSAGTMEFLLQDDQFYFMEMNTRIQVEHPVSEMVTGRDLIREMIAVAAGEPISFTQDEVEFNGHAIECRVNAENPAKGFVPCPGLINFVHLPGGIGVRVDSHVYQGYTISPYYDSMIAKIICHALTREEAISRMARALEECVIDGVESTIPFLEGILKEPRFAAGDISTRYLEDFEWDGEVLTIGGPPEARAASGE